MAKTQTSISVIAPGSLGLNTKQEALDLGPNWATDVKNAVIAADGTLGARNGWSKTFDTPLSGEPPVKSMFEYIDSNSTSRFIFAGGNKLFENFNSPSEITGSITAPTADNWKFVNFNKKCIGVQSNHKPIVKVDGGNFEEISFDSAPSDPIEVLSGWGRVWYVDNDRQTIRYSDLLQEGVLSSGSAGIINMESVWVKGSDEIVALSSFNNLLVIFGRKQVVLYEGAEDPNNNLQLADIITNTGCIARDSVQSVGDDIFFLSEDGVISIARNIQSGSLPLANVSENVSSFLSVFSQSEAPENIKSVFKTSDGVYLLTFPTSNRVFYLTFRYTTAEGLETEDVSFRARIEKPRITVWSDITPYSFLYAKDGTLFIGKDGLVGRYTGYQDNGNSYDFQVKTGWFSGDGEGGTTKKVFKQAVNVIRGGYSSNVVFEWFYDYIPTAYDSALQEIEATSDPSEYGVAEYGVDEFTSTNFVTNLVYNMSGAGKTFALGFRSVINGSSLEVQKTDLYMKTGKINRRTR
jgi:hypothetical protein